MKKIYLILFVLVFSDYASCQIAAIPPPVDLSIQNRTQQTSNWCWAACSEQVIYWLTGNDHPQCELIASAFNANAQFCCNYPQQCNSTGSLQQIQALILYYGGHVSTVSAPANEMAVYQTLSQGKAIVLVLQTTPYVGHVIVLTGMAWLSTPNGYQAILYVNDPMSYFTQPITFNQLTAIWRAAIVVY